MVSHRCAFVPPYVLEALARSGDQAIEDRARATLAHDQELRDERHTADVVSPDRPALTTAPSPSAGTPRRASADAPSRTIHDARGGRDLPGDRVRREGDAPTTDPAVTQAYDGLGATWELWRTAYERNSLDDKGLPLVATVHYGRGYDNAFWNGRQMVFGDGDGEIFLPFTRSLDVIGHELAHGVTQYTSGLNYEGQSGALNESISDVFGVLVKQHLLGQDADEADWLVGADLLAPGVKGRALRDMAHPGTAYDDPRLGRDPQPGHWRDFVVTDADNGGVHVNSGIPNRAFVLVAKALGGPAWVGAGEIWYAAITGDIAADCDFATFARLTRVAAESEFGAGSREARAVAQAWRTVGVAEAPSASRRVRRRTTGSGGTGNPSPGAPRRVPKDTEIQVRRSGGLAGLVTERTVALGALPTRDEQHWQRLLAAPEQLRALADAPAPTHPDAFTYDVSCAHPPLEVSMAEPAIPDRVRTLFDRTLQG